MKIKILKIFRMPPTLDNFTILKEFSDEIGSDINKCMGFGFFFFLCFVIKLNLKLCITVPLA